MFEAAVPGAGEDEMGKTQLLNSSEPLHLRGVEDVPFGTTQMDVPMDRITYDKKASGCHPGNDTPKQAGMNAV